MKISIIIPAYNEEKTINEVLQELEQLSSVLPAMEVIVVDDGSIDGTANKVRKFPSVRYVEHEEKKGKGAAIREGFRLASGSIFLIQDADMEYSPKEIPELIKPILRNEADVVYGSRFKGKAEGMSFLHYIGNKVLSIASSLLFGTLVTDVMTGHKCFRRGVIEALNLIENDFKIEVEITGAILKNGFVLREVPITYHYRKLGSSKIRYTDGLKCFWKLLAIKFQRTRCARMRD